MKRFPLIVSYYTSDTFYQLEVQNLIASCEKWNLEYIVEPISSFGSWERNCCYKPFFLMKIIEEEKKPLFWVDADAVFLRKPSWLEMFSKDAVFRINQDWEDTHPSKVNSGSFYINDTPQAAALLKAWGKKCIEAFSNPHRTEEIWDQALLRDVLMEGLVKADIGLLPIEYLTILGNAYDEARVKEAVIAHSQASRRYKKMINTNP